MRVGDVSVSNMGLFALLHLHLLLLLLAAFPCRANPSLSSLRDGAVLAASLTPGDLEGLDTADSPPFAAGPFACPPLVATKCAAAELSPHECADPVPVASSSGSGYERLVRRFACVDRQLAAAAKDGKKDAGSLPSCTGPSTRPEITCLETRAGAARTAGGAVAVEIPGADPFRLSSRAGGAAASCSCFIRRDTTGSREEHQGGKVGAWGIGPRVPTLVDEEYPLDAEYPTAPRVYSGRAADYFGRDYRDPGEDVEPS